MIPASSLWALFGCVIGLVGAFLGLWIEAKEGNGTEGFVGYLWGVRTE